jgi:hypothetical protein
MDKNVHKIILFQSKLTLLIQYLLHRYIKDPPANTAAMAGNGKSLLSFTTVINCIWLHFDTTTTSAISAGL